MGTRTMRYSHFLMMLLVALLGFAAGASLRSGVDEDAVVVCYFQSSAAYKPGKFKFDVEDIDPQLCTHIIYAFATLSAKDGVMISNDPWNDLTENYGKGAYERFTKLKSKNPNLKVLLAIGGGYWCSEKYSKMVSTDESRKKFAVNAVDFLIRYGFEGLDFDWYYPTQRGGSPEDKENFTYFLIEMYRAFARNGLMLTASVSGEKRIIDEAYDVEALGWYLDQIHVMTWNELKFENGGQTREMSGIEPDDDCPIPNAICELINSDPSSWTIVRDRWSSPTASNGTVTIRYEDVESAGNKSLWGGVLGHKGSTAWSFDNDDFLGGCHGTKFPLINAIWYGLEHAWRQKQRALNPSTL